MLAPPDDLSPDTLVTALARGWRVEVAALTYRAVGFGSHHWEVGDAAGRRWFVTADDLRTKRLSRAEPLDRAYARLRAALATAARLREHGRAFVVAPVPTVDGGPLLRPGEEFAVAVYPFVDGESFAWGDFSTPGHRRAVLDLVIAVHTAPPAVHRDAPAGGFAVPHRDALEAALAEGTGAAGSGGPYARPTAALLVRHETALRRLIDRYDDLVARAGGWPTVLTHGEPHPGNTMRTAAGWRLIDWDTALLAPPERDLWALDPGDGSVLARYAEATGVTPRPALLDLYRIRWNLADIAVAVGQFRRPHRGDANDDATWEVLRSVLVHLGG